MIDVLAFDRSAVDELPASAVGLLKYASAQLIVGIPASKNDGTGSKEVHADPRWTPKHVALIASLLSNRSDLAGAPTVVQDGDEIDREATEAAVESYLSDPARPFPLVMQDASDGTPFEQRTDFQAIIDEQQTDKTLATDKATIDGWVTEESLSPGEYADLVNQATAWAPDQLVEAGDERAYDDKLYRSALGHTTQSDWTPDVVPWWVEVQPVNVIAPFNQPTGAQDAYYLDPEQGQGSRCTYQGDVWETTIDANVYSPTAYPQGWTNLTAT